MPKANTNKSARKSARPAAKRRLGWLKPRHVFIVGIGVALGISLVVAVDVGNVRRLVVGHKHAVAALGWIIEGNELQALLRYLPSNLPQTYFDTPRTIVLQDAPGTPSPIPRGWRSQLAYHYTSYAAGGCTDTCFSLQHDLAHDHAIRIAKPLAMFDDEYWGRTPHAEQITPCQSMQHFVQAAHARGLATIMAPDQDLAQPGVMTNYQGGESENWQTYLRLGLAACAAQTGTQWYHIMSQPFEAHWCGNPLGECQSSEADFVNFVTQATLQAKAVNPHVKISDGLSTSPHYFGYFRGSEAFAKVMYRDYVDVRPLVNAVWMNTLGQNAGATTLYFLSMLNSQAQTERRSSVFFLRAAGSLVNGQPAGAKASNLYLGKAGTTTVFTSAQTLPGGTALPAGTGALQLWTDGTPTQTAKLTISYGYCNTTCTHRHSIKTLGLTVHGHQSGSVMADSTFTIRLRNVLPRSNGPFHLFVQVTTRGGAPINVLYGSHDSATNIATPVLLPMK